MSPLSLTYYPDTGIRFSSSHIYDFGYFLHRLHSPHLPSIAEHVRYLSFNLPYDTMIWSGVMNFLDSAYPALRSVGQKLMPQQSLPPIPHPHSGTPETSASPATCAAPYSKPTPRPPTFRRGNGFKYSCAW
jgi:hypothetical protein